MHVCRMIIGSRVILDLLLGPSKDDIIWDYVRVTSIFGDVHVVSSLF